MRKGLRVLIATALGAGLAMGGASVSYAGPAKDKKKAQHHHGASHSSRKYFPVVLPPLVPLLSEQKVKVDSRMWSVNDYIASWEWTNNRAMTDRERFLLSKGCIGITGINVGALDNPPPLGLSFDTYDHAKSVRDRLEAKLRSEKTWLGYASAIHNDHVLGRLKNATEALPVPAGGAEAEIGDWTTVIFTKRFYADHSNQFRAHSTTHQVDMSSYRFDAPGKASRFDYGYIDPSTGEVWHANHEEPNMMIYQSRRDYFSKPISTFNRQVYAIAVVPARKVG